MCLKITFYNVTYILLSYANKLIVHKFLDLVRGYLQMLYLFRNLKVFETNEIINLKSVAPGNNQLLREKKQFQSSKVNVNVARCDWWNISHKNDGYLEIAYFIANEWRRILHLTIWVGSTTMGKIYVT